MNIVVRRRLAVGAISASSALVAGLLFAASGNASVGGLTVSPTGAVNNETKTLTFNTTDADLEYGGTATFSRVGAGVPFTVSISGSPVGTGKITSATASVNFTDVGSGVGSDGPADAGIYNVKVDGATSTNPVFPGGGSDSCASPCFTVLAAGQVTFSSITPTSIRPNSFADATIVGTNFERGSTVEFLFPDGSVDPFITLDTASGSPWTTTATKIQRRIKVSTSDVPGSRGIRITNLDGNTTSCSACFFVAGPALTGMSPTSGVNDPGSARVSITFTGPNVVDGEPRLEFTGDPGGASRDSLTIIGVKSAPSNGTSMTASFDLQNAAPGAYQGVIRDASSGISNACERPSCPAFTVIQQSSRKPPTVSGLDRDPNMAGNQKDQPAGTTQVFNVSGSNFSKGVLIKTTATGVTVTGVEFMSPTLVRATVSAAQTAAPNDYDVTATLTDGTASAACAKCYTVAPAAASPTPTPSAGPTSTVSPSSSRAPCPTASPSGSPTAIPSATGTPSATASPSATATPSGGASPSASATASPSASATATPSASAPASPRPSGSPSGPAGCPVLEISVNPKDIVPNEASTVSVHGGPNQPVELYAYSRPNATYNKVRSGTTNSSGDISWNVTPGGNTRLYAHYASGNTTTAGNDSPSVVITVHTSLSLSAYRDGVRKYHFQGTNLPRRAGQLITLYRYATGPNNDQYCVPTPESDTTAKNDGGCRAIITSQAKTGPNNTWRIDRTFTGSGRFYFVVRTGENINNGRGHSNQRLTIIH